MTIIIIAAHDPNLVIGKDGKLPWHYSKDLKHFKACTYGHPILMGRKVFEELNEKPLPGRENLVLSKTKSYTNVQCFRSKNEALKYVDTSEKLFIIGGAVVYQQFMELADYLYITKIHKPYKGDTFFPEYRDEIGAIWKEIRREKHDQLTFVNYKRIC